MSAPYKFQAPKTEAPPPRSIQGNDYTTLMMVLGFPVNLAVVVLFVNGLMAMGHGNSLAFWFGAVALLGAYFTVTAFAFFMSFDAGVAYETAE